MQIHTWLRPLLLVVLAAGTGQAQPAPAPAGGANPPPLSSRLPAVDFSPSVQANTVPAFTAPVFDPSVTPVDVVAKDGRRAHVSVRPLSGTPDPPRERIVCGMRVIEVDASLDPGMVIQLPSDLDPRIAGPQPPCGGRTDPR